MTRPKCALVALALVVGAGFLGPHVCEGELSADAADACLENSALLLWTPAATADAVLPVTVAGGRAGTVLIDVDLNHDGLFQGPGELAYAQGSCRTDGRGQVRLHGLVAGCYQVRARWRPLKGQEVVSSAQTLQVLPPPASRLPVSFEVNQGQADSQVLFLGRTQDCLVSISADETVLLPKGPTSRPVQAQRFRVVGANPSALPQGQKKLPGISNYFIGNDPSRWRTNIATYQEVVRPGVYPGIDLIYYSSQGRVEYDFRVAAGADPTVIALEFPDVTDLSVDDDGALVLHLPDGEVWRKSAPVMYQPQRGRQEAVKGDWVVKGPQQAGFVLAAYDPAREVIIDPVVWSTYLGGTGTDEAHAVAVDAAGNTYVTGFTQSANFPVQGAFQPALNTTQNLFVTKVNPAGTALIYSTYLGGSGTDGYPGGAFPFNIQGIAVDAGGNAVITAPSSSPDFPLMAPAQAAFGGGPQDAVVAKLNPAGNALLFSTYLGGANADLGYAVAVDNTGAVYVVGETNSPNFPTTAGAFQTVKAANSDAFVTKYTPGGVVVYSTFLGGNNLDRAFAVAVVGGNAYVTGLADSSNFPTTAGVVQTAFGGGNNDCFVSQLNAAGSALVYSTYLGGSGADHGTGIAVDAAGNAYIGGQTRSADFPVTAGAWQSNANALFGNQTVGFIAKLNPAATSLVYSTYLGQSPNGTNCGVNAIAIDVNGNAYATGWTNGVGSGFPLVNPFQPIYGTNTDAFVTVVNPAGSALLMSSYLGGNGMDTGYGIGLDGANNIYVVGSTASTNFPHNFNTAPYFQPANAGGSDAFVTKITLPPVPVPGVTVTESGGSCDVVEGGATDTYTVVLNGAPAANVIITATPDAQETVAPSVLTFTPANWNVPQTVTVTAVNHGFYVPPHTGLITHSATSADPLYNGITIASVTVYITSSFPPPPAGGGSAGGEGSFGGISDPLSQGGSEGGFGSGGHLAAGVGLSILIGPFLDAPGTAQTPAPATFATAPPAGSRLYVFNISGQVRAQANGQQATALAAAALGWAVLAALALVGTVALAKKVQSVGS